MSIAFFLSWNILIIWFQDITFCVMSFNFLESYNIFKTVEKYNCSFMKTHKKRTNVKYLVLFPCETKQQNVLAFLF